MKPINEVTSKARFKIVLSSHRAWEVKSSTKSGTDEPETPVIRVMTELMSHVDENDAKLEKVVADKRGE
ncbi:hypothetical protein PC116_g2851 [Phytophthora cactorum]|uniref:Uncharacterized protein n=1 Tax=Phytophthora cactorum TaxID=29920 RepID=A0A8T1LKN3_9STRA|nr:hypothetical protein PC117_g23708 [Phytophthora cactorum]KAG4249400.1 hypothetical protein PC116_g2851 [Phytophthora cactorum]